MSMINVLNRLIHSPSETEVLDISQKKNKIKNNLQSLRKQGIIEPQGKFWKMSKP